MSCNEDRYHLHVLPEDAANREMADGFAKSLSQGAGRQIQVLRVAGGWIKVLERFKTVHVPEMDGCPERFMVLLIDFDGRVEEKLKKAREYVPDRLTGRVFILGVRLEPEDLKKALVREGRGSYTKIGEALAQDCRDETYATWGHRELQHNAGELERLRRLVRPILF
jgi:hypothetical protein